VFKFDDAHQGIECLRAGHTQGKVVLIL